MDGYWTGQVDQVPGLHDAVGLASLAGDRARQSTYALVGESFTLTKYSGEVWKL